MAKVEEIRIVTYQRKPSTKEGSVGFWEWMMMMMAQGYDQLQMELCMLEKTGGWWGWTR